MTTIQLGKSREELHEMARELDTPDNHARAREWTRDKPGAVREAAESVNMFRVHRVKDDAPLVITGPGTIGAVAGFTDDGKVIFVAHVVVPHPLCEVWKVERTKDLDTPIRVHVDVDYIEEDTEP